MKIGIITRSDVLNGSTRIRAIQFIDFWQAEGSKVNVLQRETRINVFFRLLFIFNILKISLVSDVIFLQKPNLSDSLLKFIYLFNKNIVVDVDDAVWSKPPGKKSDKLSKVSEVFGNRLISAIKKSKAIIVGSNYLAEWVVKQVPNAKVYVVPPSVDTQKYKHQKIDNKNNVVVGWIGSEGNMVDLHQLDIVFNKVIKDIDIQFLIISSKPMHSDKESFLFDNWTLETEIKSLSKIDIGIMPLIDDDRSRGRCGYKAIQYMALGIPVISSPIGGACEVMQDGINGILADTDKSWYDAIIKLASNPDLRKIYGNNGRKRVEQKYSTHKNALFLLDVFKKII